ncbi:ATP-binding protein [Microbispora bryophytorum]|uniref:ATP-binding protein n=1 Tax=Microbispora bryophytorum TaxID=1460882 RepID=UPI0034025891
MPGSWPEEPLTPATTPTPTSSPADDAAKDRTPRFEVRQPVRSMRELIVPDAVLSRITLALQQLEYHKVLYQEWNLQRIDPHRIGTALNLYGASGTGKSLAAEAIAHHRGQPLIDVDYAEIESKYVGDTPKNIIACFEAAARHGAVLVFNEADSILGSRLSNVTQSADHSVNVSRAVMLSQLDRFRGLVIFTTNFPRNYDAAFVRRILAHVRFDLPDTATRRRLWETLVPAEVPGAALLDLDALAERSTGLAGGDMVNVIMAAAAAAVARPEADRVVRTPDLFAEIDIVRQAKSEVGKTPLPFTEVSVDHLDALPGPGVGTDEAA